jgi:hypothetical protein
MENLKPKKGLMDTSRDILVNLIAVLVAIAFGLSAWSLTTSISMKGDIQEMQGNRFTETDGKNLEINMRAEMMQGITSIKECLNKIQQERLCE